MKGIILAGGSGTRLYPITKGVSKQLTPIYDKPLIYYPLSVLMLAGLKDVLIITTETDQPSFKNLLGDGSDLGINLEYIVQPSPDGLAQAFILAEDFLDGDSACLVLGDNIFYGHDLPKMFAKSIRNVTERNSASIFGYYVNDPERYGVADFDNEGNVVSIEEKPVKPKSNYAVVGLYFYPNDVVEKAKQVEPSGRGELEISTLNEIYLKESRLKVKTMGRGYAWLDTGTHESMLAASNFIQTIEDRQGLKVACLEEIAYEMGYISKQHLLELAQPLKKNQYGQYLIKRASEGVVKR
ncbi:glucose-1-phosphate thymidylyltransferase RfbA [Francisella adeliensis]|uniref:Glucose-1-phosphate thymidylyltransferase n=1 Tax=Francisella adeliensis TaxID=2007306 RepID=A0A2Z4XWX5_9GAMM|nr:glucose-1-phosphate thymidylyltransferase RfbA [Francisella adeliensis]AXA33387.1 glucose-1-phosphate thymidylyltransferase [Francisella adeliensis]MBK2085403.1 glucose-1-phosphate thymidylyltransferase RfbA [Francisella adeliensis]MBK2097133.1 glucose-1-phosphate thymidylyltransferase RfbA [Francisella adeliensis]QIW11615.1 glucose-1-phosphate thymidylyltransferase RfbA [Francisella adeliensis]QIW13490.1 glucose-1-phosphate thymidylyltransferase RfbA [Francisella adeliensis]